MIRDLKLGVKIFPYGRYRRVGLPWSILIFGLGLMLNIWDRIWERGGMPGDVLMMATVVNIIPTVYSLRTSNFVLSSPVQKRIWTSVPAAVTCLCAAALYLALALSNLILIQGRPEYISVVCIGTILAAGAAAFIMVTAVLSTYLWMAVIQAVGLYGLSVAERSIVGRFREGFFDNGMGSYVLALAIGLALILLGGLGQYGVSLLNYRRFMPRYTKQEPAGSGSQYEGTKNGQER
ncbi:MAG: hypothetical protein NC245_17130 [Muribaculum sp.]|nr:hypothetical protein [Muribaculum sp.]